MKIYNYRSTYPPVVGPDQNTLVGLGTILSVFTLEKPGQDKTHWYQ